MILLLLFKEVLLILSNNFFSELFLSIDNPLFIFEFEILIFVFIFFPGEEFGRFTSLKKLLIDNLVFLLVKVLFFILIFCKNFSNLFSLT